MKYKWRIKGRDEWTIVTEPDLANAVRRISQLMEAAVLNEWPVEVQIPADEEGA